MRTDYTIIHVAILIATLLHNVHNTFLLSLFVVQRFNVAIYMCTCVEVAVLKKHYNNILKNFPSDHMTSLNKLCQVTTVTDATVDKIISCPTSQESNREILDTLIGISAKHNGLTKFCSAIEKIVGSRSSAVESLRSGKCNQVCMYVHTCFFIRMCILIYVHK